MSFYDESDPTEAELARRWDCEREPFETFEEFASRMGWPAEPEQEMPF